MNRAVRNLIKTVLKRFDIGITRYSELQRLKEIGKPGDDLALLLSLPNRHAAQLLNVIKKSKSQLGQDLFALSESEFKRGGYFVEFGATNGVESSNTHLLEKEFEWRGILAEPAKSWLSELKKNRNCHIDTGCVWRDSNTTLTFNEVYSAELSTIDSFSATDKHVEKRMNGTKYDVRSISLLDLLQKYDAPKIIDYMSVDTEGSEFEILSNFDFGRYDIRVITCEHNFTPDRDKILSLMNRNGYVRTHEDVSKFDDWYVKTAS